MSSTDFRSFDMVTARDSIEALFPRYARERGLQRSKLWHKWLLSQMQSVFPSVKLPSQPNIVDLGAGGCVVSACLARLGASVTCVDTWDEYREDVTCGGGLIYGRADELLEAVGKMGPSIIQHDLASRPWPLPDNHSDIITFFDVIEHIALGRDVYGAVGEIKRICKPGGIVFVTTPNTAMLRNRLKALFGMSVYSDLDRWLQECPYAGHNREFTFSELQYVFRLHGFKTIWQTATDRMLWTHRRADGTWRSGIPISLYGIALTLYSSVTFFHPRLRHTCLSVFVKE